MNEIPQISVVIPIYKTENYLSRCIESILCQTFIDFELILIDDGSPDKCGIICDEYQLKDNRVRVVHNINQGVTIARKIGVEYAIGRYINFVDSDDILPANSLEQLYMICKNADIAIGVSNDMDENGKKYPKPKKVSGAFSGIEYVRNLLKGYCSFGPVAMLIKRELFDQYTFNLDSDIRINEDLYMNICLGLNAKYVIINNDIIVYNYCIHAAQTSKNIVVSPYALLKLYDSCMNVIIKHSACDKLENDFYVSKLKRIMTYCITHKLYIKKDNQIYKILDETRNIKMPLKLRCLRLSLRYPLLQLILYRLLQIKKCLKFL